MTVLLLGVLLTACNNDTSNMADFDHQVIFDYNEGDIVAKESKAKQQVLGVYDNSLVGISPGYDGTSGFKEVKYEKHYVEGWYLPKTDENGNIIRWMSDYEVEFIEEYDAYGKLVRKDLEGNILPAILDDEGKPVEKDSFVVLGDKWNFKEDRVTDYITLYANLVEKPRLIYVDIETGTQVGGKQDVPGAKFEKPGTRDRKLRPTWEGYDFLGKYYTSPDRSSEFAFPYIFGTEDINVYVDMRLGKWIYVSTAEELVNAMSGSSNIYIGNDIDFSEYTGALWSIASTFNREFDGNGKTISGIKRTLQADVSHKTNFGGLFGLIGSQAYIHDVTFIDLKVEFSANTSGYTPAGLNVGLFAWKANEGARFENITVSGKLEYIEYKKGVVGSNWIAIDNTKASDIKEVDLSGVNIVILPDPPPEADTAEEEE